MKEHLYAFIKRNYKTLLIILGVGTIFFMGVQSPRISNGITYRLSYAIKYVAQDLPGGGRSVRDINDQIRKIAHFGEYLILTSIIYTVLRHRVKRLLVLVPVVMTIIFFIATLDEFFIQYLLSNGRSYSIYDIIYDMLGCIIGIFNIAIIDYIHKLHLRNKETMSDS